MQVDPSLEDISRAAKRFATLGCAQLRDASATRTAVISPDLILRTPGLRLAGPAFPVATENDMLPCLQALDAAPAGWVLWLQNTASASEALAGDIFLTACRAQRIGGLVVDGAVRDVASFAELGVAVFSRSVTYVSAKTAVVPAAAVPTSVMAGDVVLEPGDWIFGDDDGLLAIKPAFVRAVLQGATLLEAREAELKAAIDAGDRLGDLCGLQAFVEGRGPLKFGI